MALRTLPATLKYELHREPKASLNSTSVHSTGICFLHQFQTVEMLIACPFLQVEGRCKIKYLKKSRTLILKNFKYVKGCCAHFIFWSGVIVCLPQGIYKCVWVYHFRFCVHILQNLSRQHGKFLKWILLSYVTILGENNKWLKRLN